MIKNTELKDVISDPKGMKLYAQQEKVFIDKMIAKLEKSKKTMTNRRKQLQEIINLCDKENLTIIKLEKKN